MTAGFALIPSVLGVSELCALAREIEATSLTRSRAGIRHLLNLPAIKALAHDPRLIELAANELGCQPIPFGATLFDKSNETNWLVVWHQDTALPLVGRSAAVGWGPWSEKQGVTYAHAPASALQSVVALRIHLDNSTTTNGPLRVLPGTHTQGVLTDEAIQALARQIAPVACTVDRGGIVMMRPLLVHASSKVETPTPRRVIHIEYSSLMAFGADVRLRIVCASSSPAAAHC
jgi:hypothetical protein